MLNVLHFIHGIAVLCGEMLPCVQHDNGFTLSYQLSCVSPIKSYEF
jgi:hypothetical protein